MEYAVIEAGGKQYRVSPGSIVEIDSFGSQNGENLTLDKVLLYVSDGQTMVGSPYVSGVSVSATVLGNERGEKVTVNHFLAKSRHRRKRGFRSAITRLQIGEISGNGVKTKSPEKRAEATQKESEVVVSEPSQETKPAKKSTKTRKVVEKSAKKA